MDEATLPSSQSYLGEEAKRVPLRPTNNNSDLHYAVYPIKNVEIVKIMISRGHNVNAQNGRGETPLHLAAIFRNKEMIEALLENGADLQLTTSEEKTALHYLLDDCHPENRSESIQAEEIVELMLRAGVDVNAKSIDGVTALHTACLHECEGIVSILLENGALVNVKEKNLLTPLHDAVTSLNKNIVKILLESGADPNTNIKGGYTPIVRACMDGDCDIVKLLLQHKAICGKTDFNMTLLHLATINGDLEMVAILLHAGHDANAPNLFGMTPVTLAFNNIKSDRNFEMFFNFLRLGKNVDIDYQDNIGNTALHWACKFGDTDSMNELLQFGANMDIKNKEGLTPIRYLV